MPPLGEGAARALEKKPSMVILVMRIWVTFIVEIVMRMLQSISLVITIEVYKYQSWNAAE